MEEQSLVSLEISDRIARVTIERPKALNALNEAVLRELETILADLASGCEGEGAYENCRVLVLSGAGEKVFVAGADIKLMQSAAPEKLREFIELGQRVMRAIEELPLPVIALVDGFAIGGGMELALACDLIVASKKAVFGQAEVNLGLIPGFGGTQRILHRAGFGAAKRYVLSGENFSAEDAFRRGIVDELVDDEEVEERVAKLAQTLASKGPLAIASAKRAILKGYQSSLETGLKNEVEEFLEVIASKDAKEGLSAFLEKRKAQFQGS